MGTSEAKLEEESCASDLLRECSQDKLNGGIRIVQREEQGEEVVQLEGSFNLDLRESGPAPVLLPGESQGRGSLVGCRLWGRTESDTTDVS